MSYTKKVFNFNNAEPFEAQLQAEP